MENKTVSNFLATSIEELSLDRLEIGNFINDLNNVYHDEGLFIRLFKCESETMDHTYSLGGSQHKLDEIIQNHSDICFVIFFKKAGKYTVKELNIAKETFEKNKKKPKIVSRETC